MKRRALPLGLLFAFGLTLCWADESSQSADFELFETKIRPLLAARCYECHSARAEKLKGGLRLDTRDALRKGGDSGPAVAPGKPDESLLIEAVRYDGDFQMPPKGKLPDAEIALLVEWVRRGAAFPESPGTPAPTDKKIDFAAARRFWSFQPLQRHSLPALQNATWPQRRIDAFVLAQLESRGLAPSAPADPRQFIRRATFDLTGLPPTPEEVEDFVQGSIRHPHSAIRNLTERLLASPRYGERWARYWLDLVRYTDTTAEWLNSTGQAYLYRDWVVAALNDDVPYDDFSRRQLATDMMPATGPNDLPALGLLGLSPTYWKELKLAPDVIKTIVAEEWEERINTVSGTFLGLTVACARCHDHKFDPITTADYYALAGVFANTRLVDRPTISDEELQAVSMARSRVRNREEKINKLREQKNATPHDAQKIAELEAEIEDIKRSTPHFDTPPANAVDDAAVFVLPDGPHKTKVEYRPGQMRDVAIQIRGNPANEGPLVPRRFLTVLSPSDSPPPFEHGSGRLELADAIFRDAAPLAARVIVNRVWQWHFGRGLVTTPSNFGSQGARPSHPELLDDLAARFVEHGWSIKWLHREIMLSATYQQTSMADNPLSPISQIRNTQSVTDNRKAKIKNQKSVDPDNAWLWRMNRRRLEIEAWRDAMLVAAGTLDGTIGGPSAPLGDANNRRRTIYGTISRRDVYDMLQLYDFPSPEAHSPGRAITVTPLQQLFALNSDFVERQAELLAQRLVAGELQTDQQRVSRAYELLFSREPSENELQIGFEFLAEQPWPVYLQALLDSNEFMFID